MPAATIVAPLVLTVLLAAASTRGLLDSVSARKNAKHLSISTDLYLVVVSALKGLATLGLVLGLVCWPIEIVAATSVALLMIAAAASSRHPGEPMSKTLPSLGLVLSAVVIGGQLAMHVR